MQLLRSGMHNQGLVYTQHLPFKLNVWLQMYDRVPQEGCYAIELFVWLDVQYMLVYISPRH